MHVPVGPAPVPCISEPGGDTDIVGGWRSEWGTGKCLGCGTCSPWQGPEQGGQPGRRRVEMSAGMWSLLAPGRGLPRWLYFPTVFHLKLS